MVCAIVRDAGRQSRCLCSVVVFIHMTDGVHIWKGLLLSLHNALNICQSTAGHFKMTKIHTKKKCNHVHFTYTFTLTHSSSGWQKRRRCRRPIRAGLQQRSGRSDWKMAAVTAWRWSVVLEQRQQVIAAVVWQVGGAQVGQQLVRVGQLRKKLNGAHRQRELNTFWRNTGLGFLHPLENVHIRCSHVVHSSPELLPS